MQNEAKQSLGLSIAILPPLLQVGETEAGHLNIVPVLNPALAAKIQRVLLRK